MLSPTRQQSIVKIALLALVFFVLKGLIWGLSNNDFKVGRLAALPVLPLVLLLIPIFEFLLDAPFSELSKRWNRLRSWLQWLIVLSIPLWALVAIVIAGWLLH